MNMNFYGFMLLENMKKIVLKYIYRMFQSMRLRLNQFSRFLLIIVGLALAFSNHCFAISKNAPLEFKFIVKHFKVEGLSPLSEDFINDYFKALNNQLYSLKDLQTISKDLEKVIQNQGYPFYKVVLPPQKLSNGDIKLQVMAFTLGKIEVKGSEYFSNENIIASLPILQKLAYSPNTNEISAAIRVANKHPSKLVQMTFKASDNPDKLDADVVVSDHRPFQATLTANNYGTRTSGEYRLIGALQYSNLWGLDHIINGSYSTSPDHADSVQQYGANYSLPIYKLKGWLSLYFANSSISTGNVGSDLQITGAGEMYGMHYQQFLPKFGAYEHSLDAGIDNRYFINDVQFGNQQIGGNVRSVPFSLLYKGEYLWKNTHSGYYLQWVSNTDYGSHNTEAFYLANRQNAHQNWDLFRYGANFSFNFNEWLFQTTLTGQDSHYSLIAGEELGIGGSYDVRGYAQRETGADNGQIVKIEISTPRWQQMNLFGFFDYGHGQLQNPTPDQTREWNLRGTGIGARVSVGEYFTGNITFATALDSVPNLGLSGGTVAGDNRIHANIVFKY